MENSKKIMGVAQKLSNAGSIMLSVLDSEARKKIINYIEKEPRTVTEIQKHLRISQKGTIAHLNLLEKYGVIKRTPKITKKAKVVMVSLAAERSKLGKILFDKHIGDETKKLILLMPIKEGTMLKTFLENVEKDLGFRK